MEENFYKDEFEVFLKEQADSHRMFPSDSVWRNIFTTLHSDEKWPALTITAFGFLAVIIAVSIYFSNGPNVFAYKVEAPQKGAPTQSPSQLLTLLQENNKRSNSWKYNGDKKASEQDNTSTTRLDDRLQATDAGSSNTLKVAHPQLAIAAPKDIFNSANVALSKAPQENNIIANSYQSTNTNDVRNVEPAAGSNIASPPLNTVGEKIVEKGIIDEYLKQHPDDVAELVSNKNKLVNRFSYTVYITPSASFRRLIEDPTANENSNMAGPRAINYVADVNKIVRHAPGTGVEAGVAFGYSINPHLKLTSGFQFNIRQYVIEAYSTNTELATIALRTDYGYDSVTRTSVYRTSNGYAPTEIMNRYYQVSIPVGLQWKIIGSKNIDLNIAGSIQPTYTLNKNAYLISTNFKNYAESGAMLRNWNVNTNVEAFLSIRSGKYKWQIGPQFRYQQLPTFTDQYPIKEHLMDYGVKIGVSKSIQ